jgi:hypothetical protein
MVYLRQATSIIFGGVSLKYMTARQLPLLINWNLPMIAVVQKPVS